MEQPERAVHHLSGTTAATVSARRFIEHGCASAGDRNTSDAAFDPSSVRYRRNNRNEAGHVARNGHPHNPAVRSETASRRTRQRHPLALAR